MYSALSHLECSGCAATYDAREWQGLCTRCESPLLARYDLDRVRVTPRDLTSRPPTMWRYHELLPVQDETAVVSLGEAMTPLLAVPRLAADLGLPRLRIKDEGLLPTGSFKARGAAVGVSRARELGATALAMPTNGNAGAAWAAYASRAGPALHVAMPLDAPEITRVEVVVAGGLLTLVEGTIADAGRLVAESLVSPDVRDVGTLREPYRIEGKKTMGYELAEQYGWRLPDVVVYPTGGGVGLIGIVKALRELQELGWVDGPLPRMVAVQSSGCAPVVRAFDTDSETCAPWADAHTAAYGLNVPKPLGDRLILTALRDTDGTAVAVPDAALLAEIRTVGRLEGLFLCPEGAACVAAARRLRAQGWLSPDDEVVLLNTGSGLIDPGAVDLSDLRSSHAD